jgi:hypothetical protein
MDAGQVNIPALPHPLAVEVLLAARQAAGGRVLESCLYVAYDHLQGTDGDR